MLASKRACKPVTIMLPCGIVWQVVLHKHLLYGLCGISEMLQWHASMPTMKETAPMAPQKRIHQITRHIILC
jgi:hypothetical protein